MRQHLEDGRHHLGFSLVTLNCLGVPFVQNTRARLATIARELDSAPVDVVCLQEVQFSPYIPFLDRALPNFPFMAYEPFYYAPKGGLMTFSRLAIKTADYTLYPERGWWHTPSIADRLLHKGILATELFHGNHRVQILNTHLTANYDADWSPGNRYAQVELAQLRQLAAFVNGIDPQSTVVIAGDFNIPRHSWLYDEFVTATGVIDPLEGNLTPTYYPIVSLPTRYRQAFDHILVRPPRNYSIRATGGLLFEENLRLTSGHIGRISDHTAVQLQLVWDCAI
ncbi:MAG: endonuclease/exonuclease/phosphatase family protein [Chloroflexi bacterium]|nr:endonuclease/exonuclease/phosphatase family protein [Chloroflexota bacterium]